MPAWARRRPLPKRPILLLVLLSLLQKDVRNVKQGILHRCIGQGRRHVTWRRRCCRPFVRLPKGAHRKRRESRRCATLTFKRAALCGPLVVGNETCSSIRGDLDNITGCGIAYRYPAGGAGKKKKNVTCAVRDIDRRRASTGVAWCLSRSIEGTPLDRALSANIGACMHHHPRRLPARCASRVSDGGCQWRAVP